MTISQMLGQSGILTLLGMAVVFGFIIILIICMKLLQVIVHAAGWDKEEPAETTGSNAPKKDDGAIVAAIAAAIKTKEGK